MARFYTTKDTNFVDPDKFLFKPPWEEIKAGMKFVDDQVDSANLAANELEKSLQNLKHFDDTQGVERGRVQDKMNYYNNIVGDLTTKIRQDPMNWRKYLPQIDQTTKMFNQDMATGDISKISGRYNALEKWKEDNKYLLEKDPLTYNKGLQVFTDDLNKNIGDINSKFTGENLQARRDINTEMLEKIKLLEPDMESIDSVDMSGMYIKTKSGGIKKLSKERLEGIASDFLKAPENMGYFKQRQRLGEGKFFDEATGEILPMDKSSFKSYLDFAKNYSYTQTESKTNVEGDPVKMQQAEFAQAEKMAVIEAAARRSSSTGGAEGGGGDAFFNQGFMSFESPVNQEEIVAKGISDINNFISRGAGLSGETVDYFTKNYGGSLTRQVEGLKILRDRKFITPTNFSAAMAKIISVGNTVKTGKDIASWANFRNVVGDKYAKSVFDNMKTVFSSPDKLQAQTFTVRLVGKDGKYKYPKDPKTGKVYTGKMTYSDLVRLKIINPNQKSSQAVQTGEDSNGNPIYSSMTSSNWINPASGAPFVVQGGDSNSDKDWRMNFEGQDAAGRRLVLTTDSLMPR